MDPASVEPNSITALQALVTGLVQGLTEIFGVGSSAHWDLAQAWLGWGYPEPAFVGALSGAIAAAILVYFRHDWASVISSLLRAVLVQRKFESFDERVLPYLVLSSAPSIGVWWYLTQRQGVPPIYRGWETSPWVVVAGLLAGALILGAADRVGKKSKSLLNWGWWDAVGLGVFQLGFFFPGFDRLVGSYAYGLVRGFTREATLKFAVIASVPVLILTALRTMKGVNWAAAEPMVGVSWLSLSLGVVGAFAAALLALTTLFKERPGGLAPGFGSPVAYRIVVAGAVAVSAWLRFS